MAEHQLPKLNTGVRFPSPAPSIAAPRRFIPRHPSNPRPRCRQQHSRARLILYLGGGRIRRSEENTPTGVGSASWGCLNRIDVHPPLIVLVDDTRCGDEDGGMAAAQGAFLFVECECWSLTSEACLPEDRLGCSHVTRIGTSCLRVETQPGSCRVTRHPPVSIPLVALAGGGAASAAPPPRRVDCCFLARGCWPDG